MWMGIGVSVVSHLFLKRARAGVAGRINLVGACFYPLPILGVFIFIWFLVH